MARIVADRLGATLGQSIVVENKGGGAGGSIGAKFVASSEPDGYTILITPGGSLTTGPAVHKNIGYDPVKAFVPVAQWAGVIPPEAVLAVALVAYAVFAFTEGAATLAWLDLIGDVVHPRLRGRFFGIVSLIFRKRLPTLPFSQLEKNGSPFSAGPRSPDRSVLWHVAQLASKTVLPIAAWSAV